jgi:hypothetical protein
MKTFLAFLLGLVVGAMARDALCLCKMSPGHYFEAGRTAGERGAAALRGHP